MSRGTIFIRDQIVFPVEQLPRVVHVNDAVEGAVYIGRAIKHRGLPASLWGNPFSIRYYGRREVVLRMYIQWLLLGSATSPGAQALLRVPELRTAPALACWCRGDGDPVTKQNWCHADILRYFLLLFHDEEIGALATGYLEINGGPPSIEAIYAFLGSAGAL